MKLAAAAAAVVVVLGTGFAVLHERQGRSSGEEVKVSRATLAPSRIVLTLESHADHVVAIAQTIVNDAYVNFTAGTPHAADLSIDYPWIKGESYEIELLTSTGSSVDFEIEDAGEPS